MNRIFRNFCIFLNVVFVAGTAMTQIGPPKDLSRPQNPDNPNAFEPDSSNLINEFIERDSFEYNYILLNNIFDKIIYSDTTNNRRWSLVDETERQQFPYLNLGNFGSASRSSVVELGKNTGFSLGFDQYNVYNYTIDSFRFYDVNRPLADLFFSPFLGTQDNFIVKADFGQRFDNGISMSLNFHRVNQKGFYINQRAKTTNVALGVRKESMQGRLNTFVVILNNINTEENNGGVTTDSLFDQPNFNFRERIPIFRTNAEVRKDQQNIIIQNTLRLGDSIIEPSDFVVQHRLIYQTDKYKFYDDVTQGASAFYGDYFVEERGLRLYNKVLKISNDFSLYNSTDGGISGKVGIIHDFIKFDNEAENHTRNDITAYARGIVPIGKILNLDVEGKLGLGSNVGKFYAQGGFLLNVGKWASLNPGLALFNLEPGNVVSNLAINSTTFYDNDQKGMTGFQVFGNLRVPVTKTNLSLKQGVVQNLVYWDGEARPQQIDESVSQTVISVEQNFKFKSFHLDNSFTFQTYSNANIQLPPWFSKHSLYLRRKVFKKVLDVDIGIERQIIPAYKGLAFMPLNGQFYNVDANVPAFNMTSAFINAKVSTFRVFVRLDNVEDYFSDTIYFQTYRHPWNDGKLRLGIRWRLLD
ncbi:MAG TPA: hypothetical protein PLY70_01180 [Saprospiraceae bacterium]|nr:hypothetical protein [Saprospiraceae bacterium]HPN69600.1 hypothetical protein [Saprospiraceae bacterium]